MFLKVGRGYQLAQRSRRRFSHRILNLPAYTIRPSLQEMNIVVRVHPWSPTVLSVLLVLALSLGGSSARATTPLDKLLDGENASRKVTTAPKIDDLTFLRRLSIDLIGRIPTTAEIAEYEAWPAAERREKLVDKLLKHEGFADRWAVFLSDIFRVRSNADGGAALQAYVHKAVLEGVPYDELCRRLITAGGRAGKIPEVGFVLGDNADPMALAGTTAQVFMGVRIACAQCHDHPFDVWKREQFYGMAAYFGKTTRRESELTRAVFTVENPMTSVKWPPEGLAPEDQRKAMIPNFPFSLDTDKPAPEYVARFVSLRKAEAEAKLAASKKDVSVDDLLAVASKKVDTKPKSSLETFDVTDEAKQAARDLKVEQDLYKQSELRQQLADLVTSPRNRYFSRALVNRVWGQLMGRGIVEPVDDFSDNNPPSHEKTLDYLANEFVAGGFQLRDVVKTIVTSDAYQRDHLYGMDAQHRKDSEWAFTAMPVRRMPAETMFDSIVSAGHLFDVKHGAGDNKKTIKEIIQVAVGLDGKLSADKAQVASLTGGGASMGGGMAGGSASPMGYDLESAIEVNFDQVLAMAKKDEPQVEMMKISNEDMEARAMMEAQRLRRKYVDKVVEREIDDNPKFASAMRMPSPAPPAHFLRVFGQPARDLLGDHRDHSPSMRQALMMLNGKMTHEASRVGRLEPIYAMVAGPKTDLDGAVRLSYREALTRDPSAEELAEGRTLIQEATTPLEGIADLRWILFNCHEFRFIP